MKLMAYFIFRFSAGRKAPSPGRHRAAIRAEPCLSYFTVYLAGTRFSARSSQIPTRDARKKQTLKTKWTPNPMFFSTPPQLQGTRSKTCSKTRPMYPEKTSIRSAAAQKPISLVLSAKRRSVTSTSQTGIIHSSQGTDQPGMAWFLRATSNWVRSVSFAAAV